MEKFQVVLARPLGPGNVGSVARLCANFGCSKLKLVSPGFDFERALKKGLESEMGWYARHQGLQILQAQTRLCDCLEDSVADCSRVIGFSRRRGRQRQSGHQLLLGEIYQAMPEEQNIALLFGNEADGLSSGELSLATDVVEIPTCPDQGSLNLSHAVAVCLARIFNDCLESGDWGSLLGGDVTARGEPRKEQMATLQDIRGFQQRLARALGEDREQPRQGSRRRGLPASEAVARVLARSRPKRSEIGLLHGLLRRLEERTGG
mmetsp:Transcript_827/g.1993  ORF Transcript_827/g.1993 Transcript_827/m.1993 type:complete len:263 (-) Transcript_827:248-1036(-)